MSHLVRTSAGYCLVRAGRGPGSHSRLRGRTSLVCAPRRAQKRAPFSTSLNVPSAIDSRPGTDADRTVFEGFRRSPCPAIF